MIFKQYTLNGKRHVSNGKRHVINVNKRVKMFALSAWMQIVVYVCMYVYEDSNSGFFRLPNFYVYAHKWLEHQLLGQSLPVSNFTVCY